MPTPEEPVPPPVTGLVAGKYALVQLIGQGGMGSVWEGRHATLGTRVAIKFIDAEYANSAEARSRFDNEARAAAAIQSKYAIQIFDHGITETGRPYIVMELLSGEPLDQRIARRGRLSVADTARILQQVSRALQRAHDAGIVHRDLKPENIFLVRSPDEDEIAKVLDFGIAKMAAPPGLESGDSATKTGVLLGTPYYMSPEQVRGLRVDHRTDLWSLGVIAYKCVTGGVPFRGEAIGDLFVNICTSPLPQPSQVHEGVPVSFDTWLHRALEREPARRFQSATELADWLVTVADGSTPNEAASSATADARLSAGLGPVRPILGGAMPLSPTLSPQGSSPAYTPPAPTLADHAAGGSGTTAAPFVSASPRAAGSSRAIVIAGRWARRSSACRSGLWRCSAWSAAEAAPRRRARSRRNRAPSRRRPRASPRRRSRHPLHPRRRTARRGWLPCPAGRT